MTAGRVINLRLARAKPITTGLLALAVLAASVSLACGSGLSGDASASPPPGSAARTASPAGQRAAKNALPDGPLKVLTVEISQAVSDFGKVPLNTPVQTGWVLRNTGTTPVSIGKPSIEVLEGC